MAKWLFEEVVWCRLSVGCRAQEGGYPAYLARRTLTIEPGAVTLTVRVDEVAIDHEVGTEVARATTYVLEAGGFVERGSTAMCACEVSLGAGPGSER